MQQILDKFKTQHFDLVTINIIRSEKSAVTIMSNYGFTALKGADDSDWSFKTYGVDATPTSFLLNPDGKLLFRFGDLESIADMKTCEEEVSGLLETSRAHSE